MTRPKKVQIVFVDDKIVAEARSQNDPYPSWSPFWAGEEALDATTATPEQIGELVLATLRHSNNEGWRRPDGWVDDKEVTPAALALGMKDMPAVRGAGAKSSASTSEARRYTWTR